MGKKHASQYANFGWLPIINSIESAVNRIFILFYLFQTKNTNQEKDLSLHIYNYLL